MPIASDKCKLGKEPDTYRNYQKSYDKSLAAKEKMLQNGITVIKDIYKYDSVWWAFDYQVKKKKQEV